MDARNTEQALIERCAQAVQAGLPAKNTLEASIYRLAAMVLGTQFRPAAARLLQSSEQYAQRHSISLFSPVVLLQQRTIASLPRFKSMLTDRLMVGLSA